MKLHRSQLFRIFSLLLTMVALQGCSHYQNHDLDPNGAWHKYNNIADEAQKQEKYLIAEINYNLDIAEIRKMGLKEGDEWFSNYTAGTYQELAFVYKAQGRYKEAASSQLKYILFAKNARYLIELVERYCWLGEIYLARGDCEAAFQSYAVFTKTMEQIKTQDSEDYHPEWLIPYLGNYYVQQGNYELGLKYLSEYRDSQKNRHPLDFAEASNRLGCAYFYAGDDAKAEELLTGGAGMNANAIVGFPKDLAISYTMLGRIAEHRRQQDKALQLYQQARDPLHMYRTLVYKVEEADVLNQVGRCRLKFGQPAEAAQAFGDALRLRQETGTATHPNCADAYHGLAEVHALNNNLTSATACTSQSLAIVDKSLAPEHPHISIPLVALAALHILAGQPAQAAPLNARLETILQKPLGPWKEDFIETTRLYADLLKKNAHPAAAAHLEALYTRQKDKP